MANTVSDFGERGLIGKLAARVGSGRAGETWVGDDAAVVELEGTTVLLTTDVMVDGIDFDRSYSSGEDIGWKVVAVNVSDIAAMGGRPTHCVAGVALPPKTAASFFDDLLEGMLAAASEWGVALVGGDISEGAELSVSVAMLGSPPRGGAVHRSGARVGDAICVTGTFGASAGGLEALRRNLDRDVPEIARLVARHLRPRARADDGRRLADMGVSAMIDVSDGLAVDLDHLVSSSGCGCRIDVDAVPVDPDVAAVPGVDPMSAALVGGEDFELLCTIDPDLIGGAAASPPEPGVALTRIGTVTDEGGWIGDTPLREWREKGWEHLR